MADEMLTLDLSKLRRKRIQIDLGDDVERILLLNTSDLSITYRLKDGYQKLLDLNASISKLSDTQIDENNKMDSVTAVGDTIKSIDDEMRAVVDYIFDTNVSEICVPYGSMYDPIDGELRFEILISSLISLYSENIGAEFSKLSNRMKSHTDKYTNKYR